MIGLCQEYLPKHAHDDCDDDDETMLIVTPATDDFLSQEIKICTG